LQDELTKCLWGDYYLKGGKIVPGAQEKAKKPLFVQLVLENLWSVYEARDKEKIKVMAEKLGVQMSARDARHPDPKVQVRALLAQWMPLASSVLSKCTNVASRRLLTELLFRYDFKQNSVSRPTEFGTSLGTDELAAPQFLFSASAESSTETVIPSM
jgi:hypothetical protein